MIVYQYSKSLIKKSFVDRYTSFGLMIGKILWNKNSVLTKYRRKNSYPVVAGKFMVNIIVVADPVTVSRPAKYPT